MKKTLAILFVLAVAIPAQNSKGRISLIYNEAKFDLPITQVLIRKENNILISIRAERNDSSGSRAISLEFPLESLSGRPKITIDDFRLSISSQDLKDPYGKKFTFNYGPRDAMVEMYYGNERMNWSSPSFQFKFDEVEITHSDSGLIITGSFSGKYNSAQKDNPMKTVTEIKAGRFEIVL
ncbi:MAG: hypothetical protein WC061_02480 [Melioribacteraceae bacterium]